MKRETLDACQVAYFLEHCIDHPEIQPAIAVGVGNSKIFDFILYFHDNVQSLAKKNFPMYILITMR
jgi:hypothetical protein